RKRRRTIMRGDEFIREDDTRQLSLPVVVQPDPALEERPVSASRLAFTTLAACFVVVLVLYGLSRPVEQPQMAPAQSTEDVATAPAGGSPANPSGAKAPPANAPSQNPQPNAQQPTTTGQGNAGASQTAPAPGGSATSATGPGAKPAPAAR